MTSPRVIRGVTKPKALVERHSPRVMLRGKAAGVRRLVIDDEPAVVVLTESEADFVLLVRGDYEAFQDAVDQQGAVAAYNRTRDEEAVPAEIVDRLLTGENAIRVWREYRGLTLTDLAATAGLSKGFLSDIENGKRTGTVDTLKTIAATLKVDLDDLI